MNTYNFSHKRKYYLVKDNEGGKEEVGESPTKKQKKDIWNGTSDPPSVEVYKNHIYFYCGVSKKSCLKLNNELKKLEMSILNDGKNFVKKNKYIYLHINSYGGSVFAAVSTIDTIKNLKVPVVSIIEGAAASAATMISVICSYRMILPHSFMLIHELSSSTWGKMHQLEDEMHNLKQLMKLIKSLYEKYTKLDSEELDDILKHDLWWNAKKCLQSGLVDEVYKEIKVYDFDREKLDL